eukprot:GILI01026575.1.p1 GENE.GILI01026575.1~~GILI01026575.1.p1  ORF type:complete len:100 (-),score=9.31 GILI01026575.1:275-574(-)
MAEDTPDTTPKRRGAGKKPKMDAAQLRAYRTERMRVSRAIAKLAKAKAPARCSKGTVSCRRISKALAAQQKGTQRPLSHRAISKMYKQKARKVDPKQKK